MPLRIVLATLLLLPACVLPGSSPWNGIHAVGYGAVLPISGEFDSASSSIGTGPGVEFDGAIDLEPDDSSAFLIGARAGLAPFEIAVSTFGYEGNQSGQVIGGTAFNGTALGGPTNYAINSELELTASQLTLGFDIINWPTVRAAFLLGVDYLDFDTMAWTLAESVGGLPAGTRQEFISDEAVPLPVIGLRGDFWLPFDMAVGATVAGFSMSYDDVDYTMLDVDVALAWEPGYHVEVLLGYRYIDIGIEGTVDTVTLDADLGFDGPYLGVSIYF